MQIKACLYIIFIPLTILALDGININFIFKKNKVYQARIIYIMIAFIMSYMIVNFFYDFYISFRIK